MVSKNARVRLEQLIDTSRWLPGTELPSAQQLATKLGVSRPTMQKALKELSDEGRITTRPGKRAVIAEVPVPAQRALRELQEEGLIETGRGTAAASASVQPAPAIDVLDEILDGVLAEPRVTIDYFGFSAETLALSMGPKLARLRALHGAALPQEIRLRVIVPDTEVKLAVPSIAENPDDPAPRRRQGEITRRQIRQLKWDMEALTFAEQEDAFTVEVRTVPLTPVMKLYIVNGRFALQGLYEIKMREVVLPGGERTWIQDVFGLEAPLHEIPVGTATAWFESIWSGRASAYTLG